MAEPSPTPRAARGPTSGVHPAAKGPPPKPLLASEVLREELAPMQPARHECRLWFGGIALALACLGLALRLGAGPAGSAAATVSFSAAGAVAALAALPFPYVLRACVGVLLGIALFVLGVRGSGPLSGMATDGNWVGGMTRLATLTFLPAALMFRARYRAYPRARQLLALALVLSVPFIAVEVMISANAATALPLRIAATLSVAVVLCGLFGFMGESSTGGGNLLAILVLLVVPIELAMRHFTPLPNEAMGSLTYPATAIGLACAGLLTSLGVFQLLAGALADDARRESVMRMSRAPQETDDDDADAPSSD